MSDTSESISLKGLSSPDAHARLHELRNQGAAVWIDAIDGWLIATRDAAVRVLRDAATFTVNDPRFSTAVVVGESMLSTDGVEHQRHRAPFVAGFTNNRVADFVDRLDEIAAELINKLRARGMAELRTELAGPLAVNVIAEVMDLAGATPAELLQWYRSIVDGVNAVSADDDVPDATRSTLGELAHAVTATINAGSDLLTRPANELTNEEVLANTAVLLFGAIETSEGMTANALWHLLTEPGLVDAVAKRPELIERLVEESLRLEPAATVVDRYATCDVEIDGAAIAKGDLVRVSLAAANRDPAHFPNPDALDLERHNAHRHLAFVLGPHVCLGLHLARAQTTAALQQTLKVLPNIRLDQDESEPPSGLIFRKPDRLTARW